MDVKLHYLSIKHKYMIVKTLSDNTVKIFFSLYLLARSPRSVLFFSIYLYLLAPNIYIHRHSVGKYNIYNSV